MNVFRRKRKVHGKIVTSKTWYGEYRDAVSGRWQRVNLGLRLKETAMEKLRQLASQREKEAFGLRPTVALESNLSKPLMAQVEDYARKLTSDKCSKMHVYNSRNYLRIIFDECGWSIARDANVDGFFQWRTAQTKKAPKTLHEYQTTLKAFFGWLKKMRRIDFDPFEDLENVRLDGRKARVRRSLSAEEFQRLLDVANELHRLAYFVVGNTGMRRADAQALTWADLNLDAAESTWRSRPETAKNREDKVLPLHPAVGDALLRARPDVWKPTDKVFPKDAVPSIYRHRQYLKKAGIAYKTQDGQADFHALRMMFCSNMNANEVSLIYAAQFMRHKDWRQTASTYNDPHQLRLAAKIAQLPVLGNVGRWTEKRTEPIGLHSHASSHMDSHGLVGSSAQVLEFQKHEPELSATGTDGPLTQNGCPTRIRT